MNIHNEDKVLLATRTKIDNFEECLKKVKSLKGGVVAKSCIICNLRTEDNRFDDLEIDDDIKIVFDKKPTRVTAFNRAIEELSKNEGKYHLLTFSKEVELREEDIKEMLGEIKNNPEKLIVAGCSLRDNILSEEERKLYSNSADGNKGIAYRVPWSTCALWNKKFVYGMGKEALKFDEMCEEDGNQLGKLTVNIDNKDELTPHKGMEDGLEIARLVTQNPKLELGYKLLNRNLPWNIIGDEKRINDHKKKLARKNIVLATFMNIKGYSIDKLMEADLNNENQRD